MDSGTDASRDSSRRDLRAQHVQADPRDRPRQPCAQVLDCASVFADEMKPGLLDGILRLGKGVEHPIGHCLELGTLRFEVLNQPVVFVHWFNSFIVFVIRNDE